MTSRFSLITQNTLQLFLIGLVVVLAFENSTQVKTNKAEIDSTIINHTSYKVNTRQSFQLYYQYFLDAYSLQLMKLVPNGTGDGKQYVPVNEQDFDGKIAKNDITSYNGCVAHQREISYNSWLSYQFTSEQLNDSVIIDFAHFEQNKQFIFVTLDLNLMEIQYTRENNSFVSIDQQTVSVGKHQILQYLNFPNGTSTSPQINSAYILGHTSTDGKQYAYVVTQYGGVRFLTDLPVNSTDLQILPAAFKSRTQIMQVAQKKQNIYVAAGVEGVDIYTILDSGDISNQYTILKQNFVDYPFGESPYFIDVQIHQTMEYLFVLEPTSGLHIFNVDNKQNPTHMFVVPIKNGKKFQLYENTVILIVQMQSIDFAIQIFIDPIKKIHYFNRIFDNEIAINYIAMYRNFGVQVSDIMNKVFYHSVYREFVRSDWIKENWFLSTQSILYGEFIEFDDQELLDLVVHLVSISGNSINIGKIEELHPRILCYSKEASITEYELVMNRTRCTYDTKQPSNYVNLFFQCQTSHPFTLRIVEPIVTDSNIKLFIGLGVGLAIFAIIVGITCCCWCRSRNRKLQELKDKSEVMRKSKYSNVNENDNQKGGAGGD